MKIVINRCHGGFSLSDKALALYYKLSGNEGMNDRDIPRDDLHLVKVVETLAKEANGRYAALTIVDIPDDVEWQIEDYDGREWVAEVHRIWQ